MLTMLMNNFNFISSVETIVHVYSALCVYVRVMKSDAYLYFPFK